MIAISVKGFQIIKEAALAVDGITMIVGSTNHGKSALTRAVESALCSNQGSDFINYDMDQCEVSMQFPADDERKDLDLTWTKGRKGGSEYVIDGVEYKKTGKTAPDELEKSGIKDIVIRDNKERLFIWRQMEEPFLVFRAPSYIFDFVSQLMQDKKLTPVLKQMTVDSKAIRVDLVSLEGQIQAYQNSLIQLKQREGVLAQISTIQDDFVNLRKWKVRYERLLGIQQSYNVVVPQLEQVSTSISFLDNEVVTPLIAFSNVPSQVSKCQKLVGVESEISKIDSELCGVDVAVSGREKIVSSIQIPNRSSLDKEEKLREIAVGLYNTDMQLAACFDEQGNCVDILHKANVPDKGLVEKYVFLLGEEINLSNLTLSLLGVGDSVVKDEKVLRLSISDLESYKKDVGVCPLCQTSFDSHKEGLHGKPVS